MGDKRANIIIPAGLTVWPHELDTARALADSGRTVEFVARIEGDRMKSADVVIDGVLWEMKSPQTKGLRYVQRILRRAVHQSPNVILDTKRLHTLKDSDVEKELRRLKPLIRPLKRLIMVSKARKVIDIS